ncbi:4,5-DOPA dioxygenase extradiol [Hydrogenophaga defluvii]|uniref:4,5-DOPA dioxygenase extradiol n=1 Tax=Hydrogenophaga defluvii TaxID=249410 RepID=A0ABW2SDH8_9BURK
MTIAHPRRRILGASALALLSALQHKLAAAAPAQTPAQANTPGSMPVLMIGHGSPMNALRNNPFTKTLTQWGKDLPRPKAILVVSAHWLTPGSIMVQSSVKPPTIHDFSGFPAELHAMQYPAKGAPEFATKAAGLLQSAGAQASATQQWGFDHGTWTVLKWLYPGADVPVFQVSIDYDKPGRFHYLVGKELAALRKQGVLIVGSGNIVHNLRATDREFPEGLAASQSWARDFDEFAKHALNTRNDGALIDFHLQGSAARMAVPTPDHYWPLLYALGAAKEDEKPRHVFEGFHSGTLSMRCLQWG